MLEQGVPFNMEREDKDASILMDQIGTDWVNHAFDLREGLPGYIVNMRITVIRNGFAIADVVLELPWTDCGLSLIEDPHESRALYNHYWFAGGDTLSFERSAVINHHVDACERLRRGTSIEGLLLWVGLKPIPDEFVHGLHFPASVIVFDQYGSSYASEVTLWADRSGRVAREKHKKRSRSPLFSKRDRSPVRSLLGNGQEHVVETHGVNKSEDTKCINTNT
jgi:hypothetical protein